MRNRDSRNSGLQRTEVYHNSSLQQQSTLQSPGGLRLLLRWAGLTCPRSPSSPASGPLSSQQKEGEHQEGQRSCTGFLLRKLPYHSSTYISGAKINHMKHFGFLHSEAILIDTQKFEWTKLNFCLFFGCTAQRSMRNLRSLTREWTCTPCFSKHRVLTTGLPGKFPVVFSKDPTLLSLKSYPVFLQ